MLVEGTGPSFDKAIRSITLKNPKLVSFATKPEKLIF
jgi:hypothetical protein